MLSDMVLCSIAIAAHQCWERIRRVGVDHGTNMYFVWPWCWRNTMPQKVTDCSLVDMSVQIEDLFSRDKHRTDVVMFLLVCELHSLPSSVPAELKNLRK